jgi:hypothetical protein
MTKYGTPNYSKKKGSRKGRSSKIDRLNSEYRKAFIPVQSDQLSSNENDSPLCEHEATEIQKHKEKKKVTVIAASRMRNLSAFLIDVNNPNNKEKKETVSAASQIESPNTSNKDTEIQNQPKKNNTVDAASQGPEFYWGDISGLSNSDVEDVQVACAFTLARSPVASECTSSDESPSEESSANSTTSTTSESIHEGEKCPLAVVTHTVLHGLSTTKMSKEAAKIWLKLLNQPKLIQDANKVGGGKLPSLDTMLRQQAESLPPVYMDIKWINVKTKKFIFRREKLIYPRKRFGHKKYEELYVRTYMDLEELIIFHNERHTKDATSYVLGIDDVPEAKNHPISETVVCISFPPCREVYPWVVVRSKKKKALTPYQFLPPLIVKLNESGLQLKCVVADKVMRATLSGLKLSGGYWCCEKCEIKGEHEVDAKTRSYIGTRHKLRTDEEYRKIANNLRGYRRLELKLGILRRSPLLDLNGFNAVESLPAEPMHLFCSGILKRTWQLTFSKGATFSGRLELVDHAKGIEERLRLCRVPSLFTRRTQQLQVKHLKSSQWLHISLHLHPLIITSLKGLVVQDVWALICFLFRGYMLNDKEYEIFKRKNDLPRLHELLEEVYIDCFGPGNMTYNMHAVQHCHQIRNAHRFPQCSAFKFEAFYGILVRYWQSGTLSIGKQGVIGSMSRKKMGHACKKTMVFSPHQTNDSDNSLIYDHYNNLYKVKKVFGTGTSVTVHAAKLKKGPYKFTTSCGTTLDFNYVGSYSCSLVEEKEPLTGLKYKNIAGYGVKAANIISLISQEVLQES